MLGQPLIVTLMCLLFVCSGSLVVVQNCTDVLECAPSSCAPILTVESETCVELPSESYILNAPFAKFSCLSSAGLCSPTKAFFNDSKCQHPVETYWTPCGVCLQFPSRRQTCEVFNDSFIVHVETCVDANCETCIKNHDRGLPPGYCYPHPGVPGLYLEYRNLEACTNIRVQGYNESDCSVMTAETVMPGRDKCFGGLAFSCVD